MLKLGLVGIGAIARSQHFPVIEAHPGATLVAAASRSQRADHVPTYPDQAAMLAAHPEIEAVVLCVPPAARYEAARAAIAAGRHVFLEKPPGVTVAEVRALEAQAEAASVTLFASWHSRYAPAVEELRDRLAASTVERVSVPWKEDVRVWHPGQTWIWQAGGFGVFDPGINALSILTHVMPRPFRLVRSVLSVPANLAQPIAADVAFLDATDVPIHCDFDWDFRAGDPLWNIEADTSVSRLVMSKGGGRLEVDGAVVVDAPEQEYRGLYDRFVELVATGASDVDLTPLMHVADAFLFAETRTVAAFSE